MPTSTGHHEPVIDVRGLSYTYRGRTTPTLENITCAIHPGDRVGLLGPNGSGKTTLIRCMLGALCPTRGSITVAGMSPRAAARRGRIASVAQRCQAELNFPLAVRQVVAMPLDNRLPLWKRPAAPDQARIDHALELTGADAFADDPIGDLSGGQLQRALIARALATEPAAIILDEPLIGVDPIGQERFAQMIDAIHAREIAEKGPDKALAILIVSHDLRAIAATCDRVLCLARTIHEHASPEGLTPEVLAEIFHHDVAGIAPHHHPGCGCQH
ncbi:MAG: metal ABC transporter ATP-binding protein [Phycisphaeraceae bacterium]|nr:metal ABC transporter ATP-binding protein [Phycisphaeraceae bacterium]MCB9848299.1 metal ABC transporter ATP-binding protein [Phycisphaeraceae bacterium]